jgi:hypothetical protein
MDDEELGGSPACFVGEVCAECGAVLAEGHRRDCPAAEDAEDGSDQG